MMLTAASSIVGLIICLLTTGLTIHLTQNTYSFSDNIPYSHCFKSNISDFERLYKENETIQDNRTFPFICNDTPCKPLVRTCNESENETSVINAVLGSLIAILLVMLFPFCLLKILGDYECMFKASNKFKVPIVHSSYLNDCIALSFQKQLDKKQNDIVGELDELKTSRKQVSELISDAAKSCLRKHDPVTGDTCLHVAFQKCFYRGS